MKKQFIFLCKLIILAFILFFVVFGVIDFLKEKKEQKEWNKVTTGERKINLLTTIPDRRIHLEFGKDYKDYDVMIDLNPLIKYAEEWAEKDCRPDRVKYGHCEITNLCLEKFKNALTMNDITRGDLKDMFSTSKIPECICDFNKESSWPSYWIYSFLDYGRYERDASNWAIVNKKTGETVDYLIDQYEYKECIGSTHWYFDPQNILMFRVSYFNPCWP